MNLSQFFAAIQNMLSCFHLCPFSRHKTPAGLRQYSYSYCSPNYIQPLHATLIWEFFFLVQSSNQFIARTWKFRCNLSCEIPRPFSLTLPISTLLWVFFPLLLHTVKQSILSREKIPFLFTILRNPPPCSPSHRISVDKNKVVATNAEGHRSFLQGVVGVDGCKGD